MPQMSENDVTRPSPSLAVKPLPDIPPPPGLPSESLPERPEQRPEHQAAADSWWPENLPAFTDRGKYADDASVRGVDTLDNVSRLHLQKLLRCCLHGSGSEAFEEALLSAVMAAAETLTAPERL